MPKNSNVELLPEDVQGEHFNLIIEEGITIHYFRKGEGTPVVLLHGWPGFWYDWRNVIEPLSDFSDVIVPDFRGFGYSDKPDLPPAEGYTPDHLAKDIIYLLNSLHLNDVVLVAHDIGATVAQVLARKYPDYVNKLVLLNPPYGGIGERRYDPSIQSQFWYQHLHQFEWAGDLIGYNEDTVRLYLSHFYNAWTGNKEALKDRELNAIIETYSKDDALKKSILYYKARSQAKTPQSVQVAIQDKINQRTLVLWGDADPVMLSTWSDRLDRFFSNFTLKKLPGIGHFVPFEAPLDVVEAVRELLG